MAPERNANSPAKGGGHVRIQWDKPLQYHYITRPRRLAPGWPYKTWHLINLSLYLAWKHGTGRWDADLTGTCAHCGAAVVLDDGELCPYCGHHP